MALKIYAVLPKLTKSQYFLFNFLNELKMIKFFPQSKPKVKFAEGS